MSEQEQKKQFRAPIRQNKNGQMHLTVPKSVRHLFTPDEEYDWEATMAEDERA